MITADLTLQEIASAPELKGREYMVDPGVDSLLKTIMGKDYDMVLGGRTFTELRLKEIPNILSDWNMPSLMAGLEYLLQKVKEGNVFYDIWDEKEREEEPSRRRTGLAAFTLPGKKKFVLICPGGGYSSICTIAEGYGIAKELNEKGYSAFILQYRVGSDIRQPKQLEDLAHAVKYVFSHAEELGVDTRDYAFMGFSAGAHLAGCFGTEKLGYEKYGLPKPGAIILGYPVVTMGEKTHEGSREFLLGLENIENEELKTQFSIEKQITDKYPPVYVWQCEEDGGVPIENSQMLVAALREKNVLCEYETFPGNAHGWGLGIQTAAEGWIDRAVTFWKRTWRL
jgi:acetyl esterase/lipase